MAKSKNFFVVNPKTWINRDLNINLLEFNEKLTEKDSLELKEFNFKEIFRIVTEIHHIEKEEICK